MKFSTTITAGLLGLGLLASVSADTPPVKFEIPQVGTDATQPATPPAAAPAAPAAKFTETQLLQAYGWLLSSRSGLPELEFTEAQIKAVVEGVQQAALGRQLGFDTKDIEPELRAMVGKKQQIFLTKVRNQNLSEAAAFFTTLKENKTVQALPDGLCFEVLKPGTGAAPKLGQIAKLHFTATFMNGQVFSSSVQSGQPVEMPLQVASPENQGQGIPPGMVEGLQKFNVGGKYKLYIPPQLAYGDEGAQGIPPGATLIFEIEMLDVKDAPAAPAPAK